MRDVVYKGKVIGCTFFDKEYDDWAYEHSPSGIGTGGCGTREEAIELLREDHLEYLYELEERYKGIKKEVDEWKDHLK